jgi:nucleotide-binding universal stress UspA family protein
MTTPRKSVLVATDLSARCDRAVDRAFALALQWNVDVDVLHVVETGRKGDASTDTSGVRERVKNTLPDPGINANILIASGSVPTLIADTAQERESALIVTGVARYNSAGDYFLGTAVDHIVRNANVPVLVVKQRPHRPYATLLIATDLSTCSREALVQAAELFPDSALHVVHAYHVPYEAWLKSDDVRQEVREDAQREFDAFVNDPAIPESLRRRITMRLDYGETGRVVGQALAETGADLAVLGTHGRSGLARATIGSNAESLLSWLPVDTLMIREQA